MTPATVLVSCALTSIVYQHCMVRSLRQFYNNSLVIRLRTCAHVYMAFVTSSRINHAQGKGMQMSCGLSVNEK